MNYLNKNESHFNDYISKQNERIKRFKQLGDKCNEDSSKLRLYQTLFELKKGVIFAKCSLNVPKATIEDDVKEFLEYALFIENALPNSDIISIICLKYLFKMGISNGLQFLSTIEQEMTNSSAKVYKEFVRVLKSENVADSLQDFMNNEWYGLCAEFPWYNTENTDSFVGYWSLVATAIAKAKMIDVTHIDFIPKNIL